MLIPYAFQESAVSSLFNYYFTQGGKGDVIIAMPTGTGKSLIPALTITRAMTWWPHQRFMLLTHVQELVRQNADKMLGIWPMAPLGIYSASLDIKQTVAPIIYGSIQSVNGHEEDFGHRDVLFIDEAHLVSGAEASMYQKTIAALRQQNPRMKVIGLSATPWRTAQGTLVENGIFNEVIFDITGLKAFNRLLEEGYLSPLVPRPTSVEMDLQGVHFNRGEYNLSELETAADKITYDALTETMDTTRNRKRWVLFASGITHAEHCGQILTRFGVSNVVIHSRISPAERIKRIQMAKSGEVQCAISNNILTTGYDDPAIDLILMLRATTSPGLWVQMLGRGTRPLYAPGTDRTTVEGRLQGIWDGGKRDCLVLDFARNTPRLGPINDPIIPEKPSRKKKAPGVMPVKICPKCSTYNNTQSRTCEYCGHEFAFALNIQSVAGTDALIAKDEDSAVVEYMNVTGATYSRHIKAGSPDSLKATYYCGNKKFSEYIGIEHTNSYASKMARDWWRQRWPDAQDPPVSVTEALNFVQYLKKPRAVRVQTNLKYPKIVGVEF